MRAARTTLLATLAALVVVLTSCLPAPATAVPTARPAVGDVVLVDDAPAAAAVGLRDPGHQTAPVTLGWRWVGTVWVYDGTGQPIWKVSEAATEWSKNTGAVLKMTTTPAAAQIVVVEADAPDGNAQALGVATYPTRANGVATGQCRIELARWLPTYAPLTAEHTAIHETGHCLGLAHDDDAKRSVMESSVRIGDGYTRPQAADLRALRSIYQ